MNRSLSMLAGLAFGLLAALPAARAGDAPDIPYTRFTLPNGLTVVVNEDHKAPVVAVSVWYHVGSSYEPEGKTGFAHLFEHLMFEGSENHKVEYFKPFERAGSTDQNGTTSLDRTNYFETVPTTALDMALWMESDRMGHLLGAIDQSQLDEQRGVVQNEKRQGENQPYGRVYTNMLAHSFPANHPYHHSTIGSMDDLNDASLETVKDWFRHYYGAANTVVVLAGDITPETAKKKMMEYFGDIPAGPPVPRPQPWIAARDKDTSGSMTDNVPQVGIFREWNVPEIGNKQVPLLDLATTVLGYGKTSRLYQRLVYQDKLADSVSVGINSSVLAGMVTMRVMVKKGKDPKKVEAAIADEWNKFLKNGPTADELERARTIYQSDVIRGLEKVGGFSGKAVTLAQGQVYQDDPGAWKIYYKQVEQATPEAVKAAADQWLSRGAYTLTVVPGKIKPGDVAKIKGRPGGQGSSRGQAGRHRRLQDRQQRHRPQQGRARGRHLPRPQLPQAAARHAEERHQGGSGRAPHHSGGADGTAVRCRLRRRPGQEAGHLRLHHEHAG